MLCPIKTEAVFRGVEEEEKKRVILFLVNAPHMRSILSEISVESIFHLWKENKKKFNN